MEQQKQVGRPMKFSSKEELEALIDEYFNNCPDTVTVYGKDGEEYQRKVPTINGLALYLGFCSRTSMYDYEKKDTFMYTIKKARAKMEMIYEQHLQTGNPTGAIFALKNFGWKDKIEQEVTARVLNIEEISDNDIDEELSSLNVD